MKSTGIAKGDSENPSNVGKKLNIWKLIYTNYRRNETVRRFYFNRRNFFANIVSRITEIQHCPPRMRIGKRTVESASETMEILPLANLEDGNNNQKYEPSTESNAIHHSCGTGKKPFELHNGRKLRTEIT